MRVACLIIERQQRKFNTVGISVKSLGKVRRVACMIDLGLDLGTAPKIFYYCVVKDSVFK